MKITKSLFGEVSGVEVYMFTLMNEKGNSVSIINYGVALISWRVRDKKNVVRDIIAGFDDLELYLKNEAYMGCIAGRYANRIAHGKFKIGGREFQLACNNNPNHLHGGNKGFDKVIWNASITTELIPRLLLSYLSKDGEEGYPGNLSVNVECTYTDNDELVIEYSAQTDKATPLNLTSHGYFNLTGDMNSNILEHSLQINADYYTPVDKNQIPTGELSSVNKTAFDFTVMKKISRNIDKTENGFDHNYVLNKEGDELSLAAILCDPDCDIQLSVHTTEPGMQFYSGNLLDGGLTNRDGKKIAKYAALCLETQHFPDSPNQPGFPSAILLPGRKFISKTIYKITVN